MANVELTIREAKDRSLRLFDFGEPIYDNLILLAPSFELTTSKIDVDAILQFIDLGRNVFFVADENLSKDLREVAGECGVQFDVSGTKVIDHFNSISDSVNSDNTQIISNQIAPFSSFFSKETFSQENVIYQGIAHKTESNLQKLNLGLSFFSFLFFSFLSFHFFSFLSFLFFFFISFHFFLFFFTFFQFNQ